MTLIGLLLLLLTPEYLSLAYDRVLLDWKTASSDSSAEFVEALSTSSSVELEVMRRRIQASCVCYDEATQRRILINFRVLLSSLLFTNFISPKP